uniref:Uncharacterized protein n=1 Tax=Megaselia scalaris TaxID=36166 RepID=T1GCZ2_MEGSC
MTHSSQTFSCDILDDIWIWYSCLRITFLNRTKILRSTSFFDAPPCVIQSHMTESNDPNRFITINSSLNSMFNIQAWVNPSTPFDQNVFLMPLGLVIKPVTESFNSPRIDKYSIKEFACSRSSAAAERGGFRII